MRKRNLSDWITFENIKDFEAAGVVGHAKLALNLATGTQIVAWLDEKGEIKSLSCYATAAGPRKLFSAQGGKALAIWARIKYLEWKESLCQLLPLERGACP